MAKLLDLLVAAEGFVPVAGRVYAQDGNGDVWAFVSIVGLLYQRGLGMWITPRHYSYTMEINPLADDHRTAIITAEAILEARACL